MTYLIFTEVFNNVKIQKNTSAFLRTFYFNPSLFSLNMVRLVVQREKSLGLNLILSKKI